MESKIAILEGDGIGPEVTAESVKVLKAIEKRFGHTFELVYADIGAVAIDNQEHPFPEDTLSKCLSSDAILFGTIGDPKYDNNPNARMRPEQGLLAMRKALGLYTNVRPIRSYPMLEEFSPLKKSVIKGVDFIIYRELTGGIYFGNRGRDESTNSAYDTCTYSYDEIKRIAQQAFRAAMNRKNHLTLVDKANVLESSRLWREVVKETALSYPEVKLDFMFVDNAAMQIIQNPSQFDVILTGNMFGDILTDEASVITGSLGMLPSASIGNQHSLYEPIHGSYPQAAGKYIANPMASMLSLAMMLEYAFELNEEGHCIRNAINTAMEKGFVTKDLNREIYYSTHEVGDAVVENILQPETEKLT
ncbi:MAG: 3-isopropylmalate dehydrogenase [Bacteroidales bacterium]|nr:3-isopropylmalate dehydrogenase [Bacteroidales bacterium]MBS3775012.1 3-isopropylmalate dehydrogenase [Bacteroidales bacterium]